MTEAATELSYVETELRDAISDLEDCERADADGRVADKARWLERYWTLYDRVLELEHRRNTLSAALTAMETRAEPGDGSQHHETATEAISAFSERGVQ